MCVCLCLCVCVCVCVHVLACGGRFYFMIRYVHADMRIDVYKGKIRPSIIFS